MGGTVRFVSGAPLSFGRRGSNVFVGLPRMPSSVSCMVRLIVGRWGDVRLWADIFA